MNGGLRFVFALWVAVTLVVAPLGAARAMPCSGEAISASASETPHPHDVAMSPSTVDDRHAGEGTDRAPMHCVAGHVCCSAICFGAMMEVVGSGPAVMATTAVAPHRTERPMPDGIASAPPLGPPRPTI